MIILQKSDFKGGKFDIPDAGGVYTKDAVQEMIDKFEKTHIYMLLGVKTGDLIIAWLAANKTPANTFYTKIVDPFAEDVDNFQFSSQYDVAYWQNKGIVISLGMKEYLKAGVFYEYTKNGVVNSQAGPTTSQAETATNATPRNTMRFAQNKFNDLLDTIEAIQWYCRNNPDAFADYNGQRIEVKSLL